MKRSRGCGRRLRRSGASMWNQGSMTSRGLPKLSTLRAWSSMTRWRSLFFNADYHSTNPNEFKSKALDGFRALGVTDEDVKQRKINFQKGSVMTESMHHRKG